MKRRLLIMTVGKTHSGKTTFAKELEKRLNHSLVIDQDNHAAFIHEFYQKLLPDEGPNIIKYTITQTVVNYAINETDLHLIVSNSNRNKRGRKYLLEGPFNKERFVQILVHFDIPDEILHERVKNSNRSTDILRVASSFEEVLSRQQAETNKGDILDPTEDEVDYLFVMKDNKESERVIREITKIAEDL